MPSAVLGLRDYYTPFCPFPSSQGDSEGVRQKSRGFSCRPTLAKMTLVHGPGQPISNPTLVDSLGQDCTPSRAPVAPVNYLALERTTFQGR